MGLKPGAGTREMQSTQGGRPLELLPKGAPQTGRAMATPMAVSRGLQNTLDAAERAMAVARRCPVDEC